jgi:hypothetical protein
MIRAGIALALGALALAALLVALVPSARQAFYELSPVRAAIERIADARYASCLERLDDYGVGSARSPVSRRTMPAARSPMPFESAASGRRAWAVLRP